MPIAPRSPGCAPRPRRSRRAQVPVDIDSALFHPWRERSMRDRALLAWAAQPDLDRPIPRARGGRCSAGSPRGPIVRCRSAARMSSQLGIAAGPAVGVLLAAMTAWWIAGGFRASRDRRLGGTPPPDRQVPPGSEDNGPAGGSGAVIVLRGSCGGRTEPLSSPVGPQGNTASIWSGPAAGDHRRNR